jgi:hypothetical protein
MLQMVIFSFLLDRRRRISDGCRCLAEGRKLSSHRALDARKPNQTFRRDSPHSTNGDTTAVYNAAGAASQRQLCRRTGAHRKGLAARRGGFGHGCRGRSPSPAAASVRTKWVSGWSPYGDLAGADDHEADESVAER